MKRLLIVCLLTAAITAGCSSSKSTKTSDTTGGGATGSTVTTTGGSDTGSSSTASADPCKLVTKDEAQAAVGGITLEDAKAGSSPLSKSCNYHTIAMGHVGDGVTILVQDTRVFDGTFSGAGSNATFDISPISGLGDQAYVQSLKNTTTTAGILTAVKKNGVSFVIGVHSRTLSADQVKAAEKSLAEKAVGRV